MARAGAQPAALNVSPPWSLGLAILGVGFATMVLIETLRPLRRRVESRSLRTLRNAATGAISLVVVTLIQASILLPLVRWTTQHRVGLLHLAPWHLAPWHLVPWPSAVEIALAAVLLDYTLWHWHHLNHLVPFLWRFHLVHHVDRDLDASTALRFHFGEQALSVGWTALQVIAIGPSPVALWIWHGVLVLSILFHHSNTRLSIALERILVRFVVTPRMHGIHHSDWRSETNSNWSSVLSVWDYLHGTTCLSVPHEFVVVGVPAYRSSGEVTIGRILVMPFRRQRADWMAPQGPQLRRPHQVPPTELAP